MGKETKTNAMRILDRQKIPYQLNTYECVCSSGRQRSGYEKSSEGRRRKKRGNAAGQGY